MSAYSGSKAPAGSSPFLVLRSTEGGAGQETRSAPPRTGTLEEGGGGQGGTTTSPGGPQRQPGMGDCYQNLLLFAPFLLLLYFLMIRPQQKQEKARRAMISAVQKNDRVVTSGGIHGVVASLSEREAVLKLDSEGKLRITIDRSAIGRVIREEPAKEGESGGGKEG